MAFDRTTESLYEWLKLYGTVPLPPYIQRSRSSSAQQQELDRQRYQTVYATRRGSVAAPTAGLHFTASIFDRLKAKGISTGKVCLHVGAGTFLPVKADNVEEHVMHSEPYLIPRNTWQLICATKSQGKPVIAVGTTSFRSLEAFARLANVDQTLPLESQTGQWHETNLFVYPKFQEDRYKSKVVDGLVTNFHQPCSTLLMLIAALIGLDEVKRLYGEAVAQGYRFLSYGDSSLLWL